MQRFAGGSARPQHVSRRIMRRTCDLAAALACLKGKTRRAYTGVTMMQPKLPQNRAIGATFLRNSASRSGCWSAAWARRLSAGGDYADLYFESVTATALGVDEQIVKSASQGTSAGCGIRVLSGERTGYAYTDNLSPERLLHAARTAALIASGPAKQPVQGFTETRAADLVSRFRWAATIWIWRRGWS